MPETINCGQGDCIHNETGACEAASIRVRCGGKGRNNTYCDSYADSDGPILNSAADHMSEHNYFIVGDGFAYEFGESLEPDLTRPRISCSVSSCSNNNDYSCAARGSLNVKPARGRNAPLCGNFSE